MMVSSPVDPRAKYARWVAPLCWTAVALEGFDLVVLGVVLPALLKIPSWGLDPNTASLISVVGLLGVAVGALAIGPVSDLFGRRGTMLLTVTSFSLFTLLCAVVDGPWLFGLLRFLAGLGLGGVLPTALALITEYARVGRGGSATTVLMTGYHVGAVLTALLGILVVEQHGWQWMFVIGAAPAVILVPLMVKFLPESSAFLAARRNPAASRVARARRDRNPVAILFRHGYARATIAFWVTSFMGLLLVYGLNTWLPQIMREAGYELGAALALLLVLNVGAVIGLLIGGRVADRLGYRRSTITWFTVAAVFLALLSIKLPGFSVYVGVLLAGIFTFSAQVLVYVYVARVYPTSARGTALGAASGIGRFGAISGPLVTGFLLTAGIAYPWGFYLFAVVAAVGAVAIATVNRDPAPDAPLETVADETPAAPAE
ncbi:aromatic acid/H+ symport family MFS transporter [Amycolatopsis sp. FDAARGOS 1241]|uniref:MFS transporter n=1 Tax=Amycolatopsis sp. FDAARGOS 1241 TaxID=2778070 RepID=UPI00195277E4|nr:aromatic acid/H+ symport family MFS transporter [Amycolatopsis sp. FDAARGOS 1241]QRP49349.1 aromatic acid/H+ symport family MFS transporter [Amycolatopsis sp. FDAARGOS 1241]